MNGKHVLQTLTHLFRKRGSPIEIEEGVRYLSFQCRFGKPSDIRKLLTLAYENDMIDREENYIKANFLYDKQELPMDLKRELDGQLRIDTEKEPMQ